MDVGGRGVYPKLYPQHLAISEAAVELLAGDHVNGVAVDRSGLRISFQ